MTTHIGCSDSSRSTLATSCGLIQMLFAQDAASRALVDKRTLHVPDVRSDPEFMHLESIRAGQHRTSLNVPLLRQGQSIGLITLIHRVVQPFSDRQIALVESFADQAVIAIENARLLYELQTRQKELETRSAELAQSLEYQTAISDVLEVISRSKSELQPVLDKIVETAARLGQANKVALRRKVEGTFPLIA